MEFVWQGLCSIAGGYVRRAYNSAQWDEVSCAFVPAAMRRPRACSSRRSGLVTALCAAVGIAFLLPPPPAFAQSTTLVSNLDRLSTLKPAAGIYAQGFRTGAHTAGYTIRNVQVRLAAGSVTSSTKTSVLIRQERNGEPGALVTALTNQATMVEGTNTFAAPANTTLNPQTNYFITVNEATPTRTCYERPLTLISDQTIFCVYEGTPVDQRAVYVRAVYEFTGRREQSGADGWSIDDKRLYKNYLGQDWNTSDRIFLFISVNGDVHTPNIEQQVEIVPPTVDGTPSVSGAGTDAQWSVGETVGVTVTFSEAVDVDTSGGTPSIGIGLGGTAARSATYASGTGTTELVFEYTLVSGDGSHGYMAVTPDSLALNGGTIRSAGSGVDALLAHNGALTSGNTERSTGPEVRFEDVLEGHDGETAFTVALQFGGAPTGLSAKRDAASIFEVTGGSVTGARVTSTGERPVWEVTVAPDGVSDVTVRVPARACGEAYAVCIGGRALAEAVEAVVPGVPLTASFTQAPATHDGSGKFLLHMEFSHEPKRFGYRTVRDALFDVEGGRIEKARRLEKGRDLRWEMTIVPEGDGAVTLTARATTDCAAANATCDADGRKFAGGLGLTVPGPQTLPVVSIAAMATPVAEGAATAYTLTRTGATDEALTVAVSVTETGSVLHGEPPASATFAAGSAEAVLSVATEDDETVEEASTVTAALSPGEGYEVDGRSGAAEAAVEDDDAAPVVGTVSPLVVAENATAIATLSATDEDTAAADLSWSIPEGEAGGADAAQFALTGDGVLSFGSAKDFEAPDDADTDGEYEVTVRVTDGSNPVDAALVVRLADVEEESPSARFEGLPERHDGETAFTVALRFGGVPEGLTQATVEGALLEVTGGRVTAARQTAEGANPAWEVTVAPDGPGEVTFRLPVRACTEANAVCIGGQPLSEAVEATVAGPLSMTARVTQAPAAHDGSNGFDLHMEFSHEPNSFSYRTVRDALFDLAGGRIGRVWRREPGKNRLWGITVVPEGLDAVTLAARATTECGVQHAVCDADGRKFSGDLRLTVPGPQTLSAVSIAPAATPVSEGTAAAFTLSRTGATEAELTVAVSVSESEASVSGTAPTSVTFAADSASATLSVATDDDEVSEDASTVTATVSSGSGYTVDGTSGSAEVVVNGDDAAPVVTTVSPIVVAENATAVATLAATDEDTAAEALSWSIPAGAAGGADGAKFALTAGGELTFGSAKDFEAPDDADTDGEYEVTVRVTDGSNPVDAALVVRLSDVDDVAPVLSSASVDGAVLTLTFGEALDADSVAPESSFAVTVGESTRAVDAVAVSGSAVTLTLSSVVVSGEAVTVGYTVPTGARVSTEASAKPVQDAAGNPAATFAKTKVKNETAALPVVSIAALTTRVIEGIEASFTLSRTGSTDAALTVAVAVSETGAAVSGTTPTSVTFAAESSTAILSVATEDDEVAEDASTLTATVSSGTGYTVSGTSGSTEVVVNDDDAAPVVATASPIVVVENGTAVATLAATDADTDAGDLSWSIPEGADGGADASKFALTAAGLLTFRAAKDYESPDDANTDGDYEVTVRVTDGSNPVDAALVVQLTDVDEVVPTLSSASVDGVALTLTFSEALDGDSTPSASSFAVTVANSARTVGAVSVAGKAVTLTLSSAVTLGETVTVGYTVPTGADAKPVQDAAGNPAAAFANTQVTNETAALPVVSITASTTPVTEGTAAVFTLTLTRTGATDAALTVAVSVSETGSVLDGEPPASATFAAGSASATLRVATEDDEAVEDASTVTAALSAGTGYEVDDASGSAEAVVEDDDAVPVVGTASPIMVAENATAVATLFATDADTAAADLSWSIPEGAAGGADAAQFVLTADGALSFKAAKDFEAPDDADADGDYEITVRVTDGANPVDATLVVRISDVDDAATTLSSASVDGATLTLTFGEALDEDSKPPASAFAVAVAGSARAVDTAAVSGSVVTLTLTSAVSLGEAVTVGYTVPTGAGAKPVQDAAGNPAVAFTNTEVTNATAALPVVSILPSATPVTEGTAAAFVLRRTGAAAAALTVSVSVSEAGSVLDGALPSSATFAAGSAVARLSVATANDAVDEADARVRASIVAGDGYEVDGESASTGVDVFDDDAAAQAAVELWSTTMTWTDLGNNWFGGFADAFSNPGWSEDGQDFRIWFISYDAGSRKLSMAHDGSGGVIAEPGQLTLHVGGLEVGPGEALSALSAFAGAGVGRVGGVDAQWNVGGQVTVRLARASGDAEAAPAGPGFSVADAQVNETSGAPLRFRVTLDAPAQSTVSVRYRTANGTARSGEDYVAAHGALRFARGEDAKTVEVAVMQDEHDEGSETMTLMLSGLYGATIADGTATGTISNTGAIPKAWIARFGRTVAEQAIEAVEARFAAPRAPGLAGTLAGQPLSGMADAALGDVQARDSWQGLEALSDWFGGEGGDEDGLSFGTRTLSGRDVLSTSSFALTGGMAESGFASFWGRGAVTRFDGRDGEIALDGEVASAMVGADFSRDALLGGLMVSHSRGEGGYLSSDGNGEVESTLTALFPYARYALSERVSVWGMAGYGAGTLTLTPEGHAPLRPGMDFLMGALGVRGVLLDSGHDGPTLAAKSDAFAVRTSTDAVSGSAGNLEASEADVTRVRFALEGSRPFGLGGDAELTPSLELGVRHDGGDAETGFGADIEAGLVLSDPARGISAEVRARGLLTHEAEGMRERGLSGTLSFDPAPDTERGLSLSLTQTVGGQGEGGVDALLERRTFADLGAEADDDRSLRRLDARIGYGLGVLDDRYTATPELGLGLSDRDRGLRLGWRLTERVATGLAFEIGLEGTRREFTGGDAGPEHGLGLGFGWRLAGPDRRDLAFDMRIEGARRDVANDARPPDDTIGLEVRVRW